MLEVLAIGLDKARRKCSANGGKGPQFISFVRETEGKRGKHVKTAAGGILATSNDWQMRANVSRQLTAYSYHEFTTRYRVMVTNRKDCTAD